MVPADFRAPCLYTGHVVFLDIPAIRSLLCFLQALSAFLFYNKQPLDEFQTDKVLEDTLFPKEASTDTTTDRPMPDFAYVRKELLRNGVTKKFLWAEYCELCRMDDKEPLMYSLFCYYIQQDEEKRRATMHIPRKPGEQAKVDWAGDPAHIIDPDTGEITDAWIFVGVCSYS